MANSGLGWKLEASEWMDGGWMNAWMEDGGMNRWMDRQMDRQTDRWDGWTDRRMDLAQV